MEVEALFRGSRYYWHIPEETLADVMFGIAEERERTARLVDGDVLKERVLRCIEEWSHSWTDAYKRGRLQAYDDCLILIDDLQSR